MKRTFAVKHKNNLICCKRKQGKNMLNITSINGPIKIGKQCEHPCACACSSQKQLIIILFFEILQPCSSMNGKTDIAP